MNALRIRKRSFVNKTLYCCCMLMLVTAVAIGAARAQEAAPGPFDAIMSEAKDLLERNEVAGALQLFEAALVLNPSNPEALFNAGMIYLRTNRAERGIEYLQRSANLAPENHMLRFILGDTYERLQRGDEAIATYQQVIALAPTTPEGKEADRRMKKLLGRKAAMQGDMQRALEMLTSAVSADPNDLGAMLDLGQTYVALNRVDEAQQALEIVAEGQPDNPAVHGPLGEVYERLNRFDDAMRHYQILLSLVPPGSPPAITAGLRLSMLQGLRALNEERYDEASGHFESVLAREPGNHLASFNLATAYRGMGRSEDAEITLRALIDADPQQLDARLRLGALYLERGRSQDAAHVLEELINIARGAPQAQQAAQMLGSLYASEQGKEIQARILEERILAYKETVARDPDDFDAWLNMGLIFLSQRRQGEALEAFENVVRLQPDHLQAIQTLATLYDESGDYAKAVPLYSRYINAEKDPARVENVRSVMMLALAKKSFTDGKYEAAEGQFEDIIDKDPNSFVAHFFLALIYSRAERQEAAEQSYKEVLRILPSHLGARFNLALLYEQTGREEDAVSEYRTILRSGTQAMVDNAKSRLDALQKRIGGFSYSLGYSMSWDTNSNYSEDNPVEELRSDLSGSITYRQKLRGKRIRWGVALSPSYSVYHNSEFDFLNMGVSPFVSTTWRDTDFSATYTYSEFSGLLSEERVNTSHALTADASRRFKLPALLPFLAGEEERAAAPTAVRVGLDYRMFKSDSSPVFDANSQNLSALLNQGLGNGWSWNISYSLRNNANTDRRGDDFAYLGHTANLQLSKNLRPGWSMNGGYGFTFLDYKHPASVSIEGERRQNVQHSLSLSMNYFINEKLRLFSSYSFQLQDSNLPVIAVISNQDASINQIIGTSPSLGDFQRHNIVAGMSINF